MKKSTFLHTIVLTIVILGIGSLCFAETVRFTTFYPSPKGAFKSIQLYPGPVPLINGNCPKGSMFTDESADNLGLMYCDGTPFPIPVGSLWNFDRDAETLFNNIDDGFAELKLGLGTDFPERTIHLKSEDEVGLIFESADLGYKWELYVDADGNFTVADITSGSSFDRLVIDENGNVGIGLIDPSSNLHIYDDTAATLTFQTNSTEFWHLISGDQPANRFSIQHGNAITQADRFIIHADGDVDVIRDLRVNGNLGVGIVDPSVQLELVNGPNTMYIESDDGAGNSRIEMYTDGPRSAGSGVNSASYIDFHVNDPAGSLGYDARIAYWDAIGGVKGLGLYAGSGSPDLWLDEVSGNIGIGIGAVTPTAELEVSGTITADFVRGAVYMP